MLSDAEEANISDEARDLFDAIVKLLGDGATNVFAVMAALSPVMVECFANIRGNCSADEWAKLKSGYIQTLDEEIGSFDEGG